MDNQSLLNRITIIPGLMGGRPTIRGIRFTVNDMLELLGNGVSHQEILEDFPYLEEEDIRACLLYAAKKLDHPIIKVQLDAA
jgi:uncharacterized protein (DUF433 family)